MLKYSFNIEAYPTVECCLSKASISRRAGKRQQISLTCSANKRLQAALIEHTSYWLKKLLAETALIIRDNPTTILASSPPHWPRPGSVSSCDFYRKCYYRLLSGDVVLRVCAGDKNSWPRLPHHRQRWGYLRAGRVFILRVNRFFGWNHDW